MQFELRGIVALIEVFNVSESIEFYRRTLGFELHQSAGEGSYLGWAWLKRGDIELMLNSMYDPGDEPAIPDAARTAAHRDTTLYIGCPDVERAYEHLRKEGVRVAKPTVAPYGMKQLPFRDPDGYGICLQWPASESSSEAGS